MRAYKYFKPEQILSLEEILFSSAKQTSDYLLVYEHRKEYYYGRSVNLAYVIARLRSSVLKCGYPVMAHHLQNKASTSQLSDWFIAPLRVRMTLSEVESILVGFKSIPRADRYEINPKENTKPYIAMHQKTGVAVCLCTAKESMSDSDIITNAKRRAKRLSEFVKNNYFNNEQVNKYVQLMYKLGYHTANKEWTVHPVLDVVGYNESLEYVRDFNDEVFEDLTGV